MTIKEQLRSNFPATIDKSSEVFSAIIANDKGTAAIESVLTEMKEYMSTWTDTPDIYKQEGEMLTKTVHFLTFLSAFTNETEDSLKNRIAAVFKRNGDSVWGTPQNIKNVFVQYFPSAQSIHLVENSFPFSDSIIKDGDFTSPELNFWEFNNCELSTRARFSKTYGVVFNVNSVLSQSVAVDFTVCSTYFFHFMMKGAVNVSIQDDSGLYWSSEELLWSEEKSKVLFQSDEWENKSLWFSNFREGKERQIINSGRTVKVIIEGVKDDTFFDYARLFLKPGYGSFCVMAQFGNSNSEGALSLTPGKDDPIDNGNELPEYYKAASYYDHSFLTGVSAGFAQDIYNDLLVYLKAKGVKANIEIINKDYIENE